MTDYTLHYTASETEVVHLTGCTCPLLSYVDSIEVVEESLEELAMAVSDNCFPSSLILGACLREGNGPRAMRPPQPKQMLVFHQDRVAVAPKPDYRPRFTPDALGIIKRELGARDGIAAAAGRPSSTHASCDHAATKAARATCRRNKAK